MDNQTQILRLCGRIHRRHRRIAANLKSIAEIINEPRIESEDCTEEQELVDLACAVVDDEQADFDDASAIKDLAQQDLDDCESGA